ncbi:hypothetical protein ABPG75_012329 [Micractinium tetrahymenae]
MDGAEAATSPAAVSSSMVQEAGNKPALTALETPAAEPAAPAAAAPNAAKAAEAAAEGAATRGAAAGAAAAAAAAAGGAAAGELPKPSAGEDQQQQQQQHQHVVLRVEVATKAQARVLTWSVIVLNVVFVLISAALLGLRSQGYVTGSDLLRLYRGELIIGVVCLVVLLFFAGWGVYQWRQTLLAHHAWGVRQRYFARTVAAMTALQTSYTTVYVAAFGVTLAQSNCTYPWKTLAVTDFLQWTFFSLLLFFLLTRLQNMQLWRGPGALDMQPDFRLQVDRPLTEQAKAQRLILLLWWALEALALVSMALKIAKHESANSEAPLTAGCDANLIHTGCSRSAEQIVTATLSFVIMLALVWWWARILRRAIKDHEQLPFNRYRASHIYIRVQQRTVSPVFTSVLLSLVFLTLVPAFTTDCGSSADVQIGNVAVCLALTLATVVMALLYMPVARNIDSTLLQEFLQDFSWTQAAMPADVEHRDRRLAAYQAEERPAGAQTEEPLTGGEKASRRCLLGAPGAAEAAVAGAVAFLPAKAMAGLAKAMGVPSAAAAAEQLRREPMFCMETAVRLFYWARLAYRTEERLDNEHVNAAHALSLFDLDKWDSVWDDTTDTHCVIGWSNSQAVVAFRGTASLENVLTDIKAYAVCYPRGQLPPHRYHGRLVKAHAGFSTAWLHAGFHEKVLARLHALDSSRPEGSPPLRIWITGHSLGGALAVLASREIAQEFPASRLTVYTLGAPRVGNSAFAHEQEELVPDTWAMLNGMDPIPWIPKWGFKRSGKRVTIDASGNLILRPSYFELSVMERGTKTKDHMTTSYALSLAAVFRAQFVDSKAFAGGAQGMAALAGALDLGLALTLRHMDLDSMKDPKLLPVSAEVPASQRQQQTAAGASLKGASRMSLAGCCSALPGCGGQRGGRAKQMLAMATGSKAGRGAGSGGKPAVPPVVTFGRKPKPQAPKREAEGGSLLDSLHATPKKQRIPAAGDPGPTSAPCAPRPPPSVGPSRAPPLVPAAPRPSQGANTCTQQLTCYHNTQRLREQHQEGEELALQQRISSGSGAAFRRGGPPRPGLGLLPAGMLNLGNTCYLNAVLQVLLSLPSLVSDLRRGRQQLEAAGQAFSSSGVYAALLECVAARDARLDRHIKPASLKRALDASSAAFRGTFQQDAHELFVALLEGVQREVLVREVARLGRSRVRVSETADPAARNFSFAVQHELACSRCGHTSRVVEEYMHLSLELPEAQAGSVAACSVTQLLRSYFKEEEEVEKSCEACGGANLPHALRHSIRRLPRVLVLHIKRFQVSWNAEQQQAVCQKLHTQVSIADRVQLGPFLAAGATPLLPGRRQQEAGKENEQLEANTGAASAGAAEAARQGKGTLQRRSGAAFYGGGGATTPVASSALLSPGAFNSPALRGRQATPAAAVKASSLPDDDDDAALQQALAASMLEQHAPPPAGQRQPSPPAATFGLHRQRHAADEEECPLIRAASPASTAGAVSVLPAELEAAAAAGSAAAGSGGGRGGAGRLHDQRFMGMGRSSDSARKKTAVERDEEQLQRALEMSRLEHEQQQQRQQQQQRRQKAAASAGAVGSTSGEAGRGGLEALGSAAAIRARRQEQEEADLQEAIKLSMMDQGGAWPPQPAAAGSAAAGAAAPSPAQAAEAGQQQEQSGCESILDIFKEVMPGQMPADAAGTTGSAAEHAQRQQRQEQECAPTATQPGPAAGAEDEVTEPMEVAGGAAEAGEEAWGRGAAAAAAAVPAAPTAALLAPAPAYLQAQIVEDDDPLLAESEAADTGAGQGAGQAAGAALAADPGPAAAAAGAAAAAAAAAGAAKPAAAQYRLHAVVNHKGPAASCGHFTSDIRDPASGVWHRFDDSLASRISPAEACSAEKQRECYLLFYVI